MLETAGSPYLTAGNAPGSSRSHEMEWSMAEITGFYPGPNPQTVGETSGISVRNRQCQFPTSRDLEQSYLGQRKSSPGFGETLPARYRTIKTTLTCTPTWMNCCG